MKVKEIRNNETKARMNSPAQCRYADSGKPVRNPPSPELLGPTGERLINQTECTLNELNTHI